MPVLLFIEGQLILASHGRVITFRVLHDLQKTWKNSTKICKFCNIIVEARWDKFWLNLMYSNILSQCWYLSKSNSFEPLMTELSPLESYTIYKKREKIPQKYVNLQHHCRGQMIQIAFKLKVEQHPKRVLLFIKGQLIWAAHGRVITFRVLHDLSKTWKITQKYINFATSL